MPDYGKPIENDLHWKSTLDFFKEDVEDIEKVDARAIGRGIVGGLRGEKESPYKEGLTRGLPEGDVDPETGEITDHSYGEQHSLIPFTGKGEEQYPQYRQGYRGGKGIRDTALSAGEGVGRFPRDVKREVGRQAREAKTGFGWGRDERAGALNRANMEIAGEPPGVAARIGEIAGRATKPPHFLGQKWLPSKEDLTRQTEPPPPKEGSLKLMKDGDTQELNPMEDPPKENKESQAKVADGDSKRPKSEVGTNDKMFKKAHDWQAGEGPEPWQTAKAKRWARIKRNVEAKRANQATQETLPGFPEPEPPEEELPTPDEVEHSVEKVAGLLATAARAAAPAIGQAVGEKVGSKIKGEGVEQINKVMEHSEDRPRKSIRYLMPSKRLQQLRQGDTDGPTGSKRVAPGEKVSDRAVTSAAVFNAKPHTVPEDLPVKVRNSVENSLLKLMKTEEPRSRQAMETEFPVRHPDDTIDPRVRVSSRTGVDTPIRPDPTQPPIAGEEEQQDWDEAGSSERGRGGKPSGIYGVRPNNPGLGRRRTDENASGQPNYRKIPIGKTDMEKGGTFWGGTRKQDVPKPLPQREQPWGRKENEAAKQAGVERSIARLRTPRNWYSSDQGRGNIGDTRGQRKKSIEKEHIGGQGLSDQSEGFDTSKPLPKAPVTGPDHPEGPGVPLTGGWTDLERETMEESDSLTGSEDYAQDPDAKPTLYQGVTEPWVRPSRAKRAVEERRQAKNPIEKSLLKLMKAEEGFEEGTKPFYHPDNTQFNGEMQPGPNFPGFEPTPPRPGPHWHDRDKKWGDNKSSPGSSQLSFDIFDNQLKRFAEETGTQTPTIQGQTRFSSAPSGKVGEEHSLVSNHPHADFAEWHKNDWAKAQELEPDTSRQDEIDDLNHQIKMGTEMRGYRLPSDHPESSRAKYEEESQYGHKPDKWTKKAEKEYQKDMAAHKARLAELDEQGSHGDTFGREFPDLAVENSLIMKQKL